MAHTANDMESFVIITFCILTLTLWLWAFIDITRSRRNEPKSTTFWFWLIMFFPVIGSILYFQLKDRWFKSKDREFRPSFNRNV
ncbi:PLDc N-terminal domain-containing protein [Marinoscillum sp. MHG1-6]|uniref:PLDc N-terminal domain-containing protein n=1 Tax=Marinoscillum sp. MHG1-6 TaxID=2959627 RepID=UPI0035BE446A